MKRKSKSIAKVTKPSKSLSQTLTGYDDVLRSVVELLESARRNSARAVNSIMTATYWEIGRRLMECDQGGEKRAEYGMKIVQKLSDDLTSRFGRGFSKRSLEQMRRFYCGWPIAQTVSAQFNELRIGQQNATSQIAQTPSAQSDQSPIFQTLTEISELRQIANSFPLPWSHYVALLKVEKSEARKFYETEALRGGWGVRQLDRQISTLFYERTLASRNKKAMLEKGSVPRPDDILTAEQEIKDPLVLEFLGLKDEYSESDLEEVLIKQLETFLLELGGDFTFVGRQRRLRIDDEWYRVDLLFFHRALRCLVVIDLKIGKFTHADAGQMLLYLGYAAEHWTRPGENPPVGLILCAQHNQAVAHYTIDRLPDQVLAAEYRLALPNEATLVAELERTQARLSSLSTGTPSQKPNLRSLSHGTPTRAATSSSLSPGTPGERVGVRGKPARKTSPKKKTSTKRKETKQ